VPNAALRFRPTEEMLAQAGITPGAGRDSTRARGTGATGATGGSAAGARNATDTRGANGARGADSAAPAGAVATAGARRGATLWYLDESGKPARVRVRTGLSDGQRTAVDGEGLREGMRVIIGITQGGGESSSTSSSPFNTQQQRGGPPRPGGF
jgi:HlyD family secretion protein